MRKMLFIFWSAEFIINLQGMKRNAFLSAVTAHNSYPENLEACANSVDPDQMPQCGIWSGSTLFATIQQFLDISRGSNMDLFKIWYKYGKALGCLNM